MKLLMFLVLVFLSFPKDSFGIVKRDDVSAQKYIVQTRPTYLIDMPHEGHGVLIKPNCKFTIS